jgi:uncharacterized RDD family membrane protein YckC
MAENPYRAPDSNLINDQKPEPEYAGFWIRLGATIVDTILLMLVSFPLLWGIYGDEYFNANAEVAGVADVLISWVFPAVAIILFWIYKSATPGKMAFKLRIVDARSGDKPSMGQFIGRYLGYWVSGFALGLGLLWVAFDRRKQSWHDKLAGTVVVRNA